MKTRRTNGISVFVTEDVAVSEAVIRIEEDNPNDPDNPVGVELTLEQESLIRDFIFKAACDLRTLREKASKRRARKAKAKPKGKAAK